MPTAICVFDDRGDAQLALDRLVERGFSPDRLHLRNRDEPGTGAAEEEHGLFHGISRYFHLLVDPLDRSTPPSHYVEAVRRGSTVLVVDAVDEPEAERARDLMCDTGGHVDMDERVSQWRREGWTEGGAPGTAAPTEPPGRSGG